MKFIFSISLIIISGVLFFSIVNPLRSDISQLSTEVKTYNIALNNSTELQKTRDNLVDTYKHIVKEDKDRLERFLPNTVNNIRFILELERIANLHSMSIKNIKFDSVKTQEAKSNTINPSSTAPAGKTVVTASDPSAMLPYGVFPVEFSTDANYDTFALFLKDLEHNLRLVDIKSVSFAVPDKAGTNPSIYTYTLKVETYWLK
jgi:Tfp pilus assembly protein PilO